MDESAARTNLEQLIRARGENYGALSRLLGRNPAYIQQYVKRGTPRKLDEADRRKLARYFGVDEALLGAPGGDAAAPLPGKTAASRKPGRAVIEVPRLALGASAGGGALDQDEAMAGLLSFDASWLRALGGRPDMLSIISVQGESMAPTLGDGDDIMVDRGDGADRMRDGIYVLRMDDTLMVKRITLMPRRGRISVRSDNALYPSWEDIEASDVTLIGRVIWAGRRLR